MALQFKIDTSQFNSALIQHVEKHKVAAKRAVKNTGYRVLYDAIFEAPTPPVEWGTLRGSHSLVVTGGTPEKNVIDSSKSGGATGKQPSVRVEEPYILDMKPLECRVGFNVPYALNQHENHTPDGNLKDGQASAQAGNVGSKFLEKKLIRNAAKYQEMIAKFYAQEINR
jgi:hypothetical protein